MVPKRRVHPLIKVAVAIVLLAGVAVLFIRSVKDTRAEPYIVNASHLRNWALGIDTAADADGAVVSLRPQPELPMNLFRQLFSRQMESLGTPSQPGIPFVLRREIPSEITADAVLALAREAGLDRAVPSSEMRRLSARVGSRHHPAAVFHVVRRARLRSLQAGAGVARGAGVRASGTLAGLADGRAAELRRLAAGCGRSESRLHRPGDRSNSRAARAQWAAEATDSRQ